MRRPVEAPGVRVCVATLLLTLAFVFVALALGAYKLGPEALAVDVKLQGIELRDANGNWGADFVIVWFSVSGPVDSLVKVAVVIYDTGNNELDRGFAVVQVPGEELHSVDVQLNDVAPLHSIKSIVITFE